ncbi:MAG: hypothetical protein AB1351_08645 [Thermoproteota archaeon]
MSSEWSQWLDFDRPNVEVVPELPGVCVMHASMKTLYIGGSDNIRQELLKRLSDSCTSKAKRFKYILTSEFVTIKKQQIKEYVEKHGKLPLCMEQNAL